MTRAVEGNVLNYNELLVFVYAVLSSRIAADEIEFIKGLVYLPEHVTRMRRRSFTGTGIGKSTTLSYRRRFSDSAMFWKDYLESVSLPLSTDTTLQSNEATGTSPSTLGATNIPEPETVVISKSEYQNESVKESVERDNIDEKFLKNSSIWYKHAHKYPRIKFSNYFTKQVVTYGGGIISGEGIELRIPGRAIKREDSVEFTVHACIDGPFDFPEDVNLITPVYVISPHYEFQREVTVLMDSFVRLHPLENNLVFLTSPTKREVDECGSYWKFEINERKPWRDGINEHRIILELSHFCLLCFGLRKGIKLINMYYNRVTVMSTPNESNVSLLQFHGMTTESVYIHH